MYDLAVRTIHDSPLSKAAQRSFGEMSIQDGFRRKVPEAALQEPSESGKATILQRERPGQLARRILA
jgi:hypothetical protein